MAEQKPPVPPFTDVTAWQKVKAAQDAWNSKDLDRVVLAYTEDCEWRNRSEFLKGREAIREFLSKKWEREQGYVLRKYLFAHSENRIAVCFEYEYHDASGQWYRAYGNENWEFDHQGLMRKRIASINEAPIAEGERRIAVEEPTHNTWLADQGIGGSSFPLGGGSASTYG